MAVKKYSVSLFMSLVCFLFLFSASFAVADAQQKILKKVETHQFRLYEAPSKRDAYSATYPIKLDEMGMITVNADIGGGKIKGNENPFKLWIIDARGIKEDSNKIDKKYIKRTTTFKRLGCVTYPVDALELNQTKGEYVIMISNLSKESHGVGTITISYPAKEEKPREAKERYKRD